MLYALTVYYRKIGSFKRAGELYSETISLDEYWAGLVYVAAYAEQLNIAGN